MGIRYQIPPPPKYWWYEGDYGITFEELVLIRKFVTFKTFDNLAKQEQCSPRTIRRQLESIFAKIGAKDRQNALDILQSVNIPNHIPKKGG